MDPKGEKEGWGAWDRTGKRQFRSDVNKPTKFEGQKRDYNTHVGANLTSYGNLMREGKASEDDTIRSLASTLGHEYTPRS